MIHERYEMVVGLEVHVQLRTKTKAFCRCATAFGAAPNVNTCPVCLALPGALPVLNARAVELATRAALALGCTVHGESIFARKNYFYPDLPKGYQITQFDRPLATGGAVRLGDTREIAITRIHMEEDAGKSVHDRFAGFTAIDLNRAGVPLVEIVSEPDIRSSSEAAAFLHALREILVYAGVSDCSMEEGSLRVDANVSARPRGESTLRTRTEIKNLNSFSNAERAIEHEFARHCAAYDADDVVVQQTMLYDDRADAVRSARSKEESHDYRYFPEPDLPPLLLDREYVERVRNGLPEFPAARRARYVRDLQICPAEADVLTADRDRGDYFEAVANLAKDAKTAANWVIGEVMVASNADPEAAKSVSPQRLADLIGLVAEGIVSNTAAKKIYGVMTHTADAARTIAEREGLLQVGDEAALIAWISEVFAENPAEADRFIGGETRLQGVLVGLVMKKSKGRADPKKVNQLISDRAAGR